MGKFGFIIHPLDMEYVKRFEPKVAGKSPALVQKVMEWTPSFKLSEITGVKSKTGKEISGWLIGCPLMPADFINKDLKYVLDKIIQAGKVAEDLGAKIVGLGGYTSIVGGGGAVVAKNLNIAVTNGNSYTVATTIEITKKAAETLGIDISNSTVVIIGATGSIGGVCSKILSKETKHLILVARNQRRLKELAEETKLINPKALIETSDSAKSVCPKGDIVITATSTPHAIIGADDLKFGALVCDVSRPRNVSEEIAKKREDVLVIEGGVIKVPGNVDFHFDFGFPPGLAYACMSETMILTLEERYENYSIGRELSIQKVKESLHLAEKHGFELAGFRSFDRPLTEEDIDRVRKIRKRGR